MILCCTEEWGRFRILGVEIVSNWCQHRNEAIVPIRQRENAELVEHVLSVRDRGEKPVQIFLVYALREEGDDSEEVTSVGAEVAEHRGSEREFEGCCQALVVIGLKNLRSLSVPLLGKLI